MTDLTRDFSQYFPLDSAQLRALWDEPAIVTVDTNVLLNLYRYKKETSEELIELLEDFGEQLWIPHQVALEFARSRPSVIIEQRQAFSKLLQVIEKEMEELPIRLQANQSRSEHPTLRIGRYAEQLAEYLEQLRQEVKTEEEAYPNYLRDGDPILSRLEALFENRVGEAPTVEELECFTAEAKERYEKKIPPGYEDADKSEDRRYGDFILWRQILAHVAEEKKGVILVTDERKEDWWWKVHGETVGPQPRLRADIKEAAGVAFHMYSSDWFMQVAAEHLKRKANEAAVTEARKVRQLDERALASSSVMDTARALDRMIADLRSTEATERMLHSTEALETLRLWQEADHRRSLETMLGSHRELDDLYKLFRSNLGLPTAYPEGLYPELRDAADRVRDENEEDGEDDE